MSTGKQLTALLLLTTALTFPAGAAFAQDASTGAEGVPAEQDPATDAVMAQLTTTLRSLGLMNKLAVLRTDAQRAVPFDDHQPRCDWGRDFRY